MKKIIAYTDGGCSGNPGPGGWAAILNYNGYEKTFSGGEELTTNNRMELMAVIEALSAIKEPCEVDLHTDSQYVSDAFNQGYLEFWINNGWKTKNKTAVKNDDLWKRLIELTKTHKVNFIKVLGHSGVEYNEKCDKIAKQEILKHTK